MFLLGIIVMNINLELREEEGDVCRWDRKERKRPLSGVVVIWQRKNSGYSLDKMLAWSLSKKYAGVHGFKDYKYGVMSYNGYSKLIIADIDKIFSRYFIFWDVFDKELREYDLFKYDSDEKIFFKKKEGWPYSISKYSIIKEMKKPVEESLFKKWYVN